MFDESKILQRVIQDLNHGLTRSNTPLLSYPSKEINWVHRISERKQVLISPCWGKKTCFLSNNDSFFSSSQGRSYSTIVLKYFKLVFLLLCDSHKRKDFNFWEFAWVLCSHMYVASGLFLPIFLPIFPRKKSVKVKGKGCLNKYVPYKRKKKWWKEKKFGNWNF